MQLAHAKKFLSELADRRDLVITMTDDNSNMAWLRAAAQREAEEHQRQAEAEEREERRMQRLLDEPVQWDWSKFTSPIDMPRGAFSAWVNAKSSSSGPTAAGRRAARATAAAISGPSYREEPCRSFCRRAQG